MPNQLIDRFIRYVKKETRSDEASTTVPSTPSQTEFLKDLVEELVALGYQDVSNGNNSSYNYKRSTGCWFYFSRRYS